MEHHEPFLREAIALSKSAMKHGDEPFGSLLMKGGEIILRAENSVFTGHDMTNHAEMNLVKLAATQYDTAFLGECTLYTSTEPCAMCSGAIYWSGIACVCVLRNAAWRDRWDRVKRAEPSSIANPGAQSHCGWPDGSQRRSGRGSSRILA